MIFSPSTLATQWDVWLYFEDGVHFLFYLASTTYERPWDAIGLAISEDGVHFQDRGPIVTKDPSAEWLGTGHTWRAGDKYILNFSESHGGRQEILFAESSDLLHWMRVPRTESVCVIDHKWYSDGTAFASQRWDCIWANTDASGMGYFGYLTAVGLEGPEGLRGTAGTVRSTDGRTFVAGPPAIEPGIWGDRIEIGGVAKQDSQYFMLVSQLGIPLGARGTAHHPESAGGSYVLRADAQQGPFELDPRQRPLLVSAPLNFTYFLRFYQLESELLAVHHSIAPRESISNLKTKPGTHLAPLKRVQTKDGIMSLHWWLGNEALKFKGAAISTDEAMTRGVEKFRRTSQDGVEFTAAAGGLVACREFFDLTRGVVIELECEIVRGSGPVASVGLLIGGDLPWGGTVIILGTDDSLSIGPYDGYAFQAEDVKQLTRTSGAMRFCRVLVKNLFVEVYVDEEFVQAYTLPRKPSGRISLVAEAATVRFDSVSCWYMTK